MAKKQKPAIDPAVPAATEPSKRMLTPYQDWQRHTCLEVTREHGFVKHIPMDVTEGLRVVRLSTPAFEDRYKKMFNYDPLQAAKKYLSVAETAGATIEVMKALQEACNLTPKEFDMATKKVAKAAAKKLAAKKPAAKKPASVAKEPGAKRESASQMFQDLIMAGNLTDDKIFEKVQAKYGLDEKKRSYVVWYRNHLTKLGKKPPVAK